MEYQVGDIVEVISVDTTQKIYGLKVNQIVKVREVDGNLIKISNFFDVPQWEVLNTQLKLVARKDGKNE